MKPVFPRINTAIKFTLEYFDKEQVIEYMEAYTNMAQKKSHSSYKVDHWEELMYDLYRQMENEILQTIYTTNQTTKVIMFEDLREWLNVDWRLKQEPDWSFFLNIVDEHNEKVNLELEERLAIEVEKFLSTDEYKTLGQNEEYQKTLNVNPLFGSLIQNKSRFFYLEKRINRKYYCNELNANFLDYYEVKTYTTFVKKIVGVLRDTVEKHLKNFDAGKYVPLSEVAIQKELISASKQTDNLDEKPDAQISQKEKIKVNITVKQFLYLFKALIDAKIIQSPKHLKSLHEIIATNFYTEKSEDTKTKKIQTYWGEIQSDPKIAAFWMSKFIDLEKLAKKDNPNNIRLNY